MSRTTDAMTVDVSTAHRDIKPSANATDSGTDKRMKREPIGPDEAMHSIQTTWADVYHALAQADGEQDIHPDVVEAARGPGPSYAWRPVEHHAALAASSLLSLLECDHSQRMPIATSRTIGGGIRLQWDGPRWVAVEYEPRAGGWVQCRLVHAGGSRSWTNPHLSDIYNALDTANLLPCDVDP